MARISAAEAAREEARTSGTHAKLDRSWDRWILFLQRIELTDDPFLDSVAVEDRSILLGAFAAAVREREFSRPGEKDLAKGTVKEAMDKVAEVFRSNNRGDPRNGTDGKQDIQLKLQLMGYKSKDPATKQEKAFTPFFFRQLYHRSITSMQLMIANLAILAFFFAMRSCEYVKTSGERKTKLVRLQNLEFWSIHNHRLDLKRSNLYQTQLVSITFEDQKNGEKMDRCTQDATGDLVMCPVRAAAALVKYIYNIPGTDLDIPICTFWADGKLRLLTQDTLLMEFRSAVRAMGEDKLGFKAEDIGTHSIRSAAAMSMFLDNVPVFLIMLVGRWSSDAFLKYIRKQVLESSRGISKRMIKNDLFFTLPDMQSSSQDPRTRNPNSFASHLSVPMADASGMRAAMRPSFSLHY